MKSHKRKCEEEEELQEIDNADKDPDYQPDKDLE